MQQTIINPYVRLHFYYMLLINNYDYTAIDDSYKLGIPIQRLHQITDIPLQIIREDILCMFQWQNSVATSIAKDADCASPRQDNLLEFDNSCVQYKRLNKRYHLDILCEQLMDDPFPTELESLLLNGTLDSLPIYMDNQTADAVYHIPLSAETIAALCSFHAKESDLGGSYNSINQKYQYPYHIKDSYLYTHNYNALHDKLDLIHRAINEGLFLQMKYKTAQRKIIDIIFQPIKVSYNSDENLYCIISIYKNKISVHRIDHILSIDFAKKSSCTKDEQNLNLLDIAPNVWGNFFSGIPQFVKIKFYNEANVWTKVKKELANRTNGKLYEKDGFLYYEDFVYGISKLRSWLYGYSSSAVVLEPDELRQQILDSLKTRQTQNFMLSSQMSKNTKHTLKK